MAKRGSKKEETEVTPAAATEQQIAVAEDLNKVLQLDPPINTELDSEALEASLKLNASEIYYKHPEHGTDALQQTTFEYMIAQGYLVEPEVKETAAQKKAREKADKDAQKKADGATGKTGGGKKGGFSAKPEVAERKKFIEDLITAGKSTAKEIVEKTMAKFPDVSKGSISTMVSDSKNEKYTQFGKVAVQHPDTKIMSW